MSLSVQCGICGGTNHIERACPDAVRAALIDLVRLKDLKQWIEAGLEGVDEATKVEAKARYEREKEPAWEAARLALESLPSQSGEINQCDGCRRGLPTRTSSHGTALHDEPGGSMMACSADRYARSSTRSIMGEDPQHQQAVAWQSVVHVLNELDSEWMKKGTGSATKRACDFIRQLGTPSAIGEKKDG